MATQDPNQLKTEGEAALECAGGFREVGAENFPGYFLGREPPVGPPTRIKLSRGRPGTASDVYTPQPKGKRIASDEQNRNDSVPAGQIKIPMPCMRRGGESDQFIPGKKPTAVSATEGEWSGGGFKEVEPADLPEGLPPTTPDHKKEQDDEEQQHGN